MFTLLGFPYGPQGVILFSENAKFCLDTYMVTKHIFPEESLSSHT